MINNRKVLLVYIKTPGGNDHGWPMGLGYLKSVLAKANYESDIISSRCVTDDEISDVITMARNYGMIGFSCYCDNIEMASNMATLIKGKVSVPIIAGGPEVTYPSVYNNIFQSCPGFDVLVKGEAEESIVHLCNDYFTNGRFTDPFPSVSYRELNGSMIVSNESFRVTDLDSLPYPIGHHDMIDWGDDDCRSITFVHDINTSRGCSMGCTFCMWTNDAGGGAKKFSRSVDSCAKEIISFLLPMARRGVKNFMVPFSDDHTSIQFLIKVMTIVNDELSGYIGINIRVGFLTTVLDVVKVGIDGLKRIKDLNVFSIFIGIENLSASVLRRYGKPHRPDQAISAMRMLEDSGIPSDMARISYGFITFDPLTTIDELKENIRAIKDNGLQNMISVELLLRSKLYKLGHWTFKKYDELGYDNSRWEVYYRTDDVKDYFDNPRIADIYNTLGCLVETYWDNDLITREAHGSGYGLVSDVWTSRAIEFFETLLYDAENVPTQQRFHEFMNRYHGEMKAQIPRS